MDRVGVEDWLKLNKVKNYTINEDLSVDINGHINLSDRHLDKISVRFGIVSGNFYCNGNDLTSLSVLYNKVDSDIAKTRIALAIYYGVNLNPWKLVYPTVFSGVIEMVITSGFYEEFGIDSEKIILLCVTKKYVDKEVFIEVSLSRGLVLGKRYLNNDSEKSLNVKVLKNKWLLEIKRWLLKLNININI